MNTNTPSDEVAQSQAIENVVRAIEEEARRIHRETKAASDEAIAPEVSSEEDDSSQTATPEPDSTGDSNDSET